MAKNIDVEFKMNNYYINQNSIKSHSSVRSFLRGALASTNTTLWPVATPLLGAVATFALAPIVGGAFLGAGIGLSIGVPALFAVRKYNKELKKPFDISEYKKAYPSKGTEGEVTYIEWVINKIQKAEKNVVDYEQILIIENDRSEHYVDGEMMSTKELSQLKRLKESFVYEGLKILLNEGVRYSNNLIRLNDDKRRTEERVKEARDEMWDGLNAIALCVKDITYKHNSNIYLKPANKNNEIKETNPYKNLIIDSISKGCLLAENGLDSDDGIKIGNETIRLNRGNKKKAKDIYSIMYETPILEDLRRKQDSVNAGHRIINKGLAEQVELQNGIITGAINSRELTREQRELYDKNEKNIGYLVLIRHAENVAKNMPEQMKADKTLLLTTSKAFKQAIATNNQEDIDSQKEALDQLIELSQGKVQNYYYKNGISDAKNELTKTFEEYKKTSTELQQQTEAELNKAKKGYARAINHAVGYRTQGRTLSKTNEQLNSDLSDANAKIYDLTKENKQNAGLLDELTRKTNKQSAVIAKSTRELERANEGHLRALTIAGNLRRKNINAARKLQDAEIKEFSQNLIIAAQNDVIKKNEEDLSNSKKDLAKSQQARERAVRAAFKRNAKINELNKANEFATETANDALDEVTVLKSQLAESTEALKKQLAESKKALGIQRNNVAGLKEQVAELESKNKKATRHVENEKIKSVEAAKTIASKDKKIAEQEGTIRTQRNALAQKGAVATASKARLKKMDVELEVSKKNVAEQTERADKAEKLAEGYRTEAESVATAFGEASEQYKLELKDKDAIIARRDETIKTQGEIISGKNEKIGKLVEDNNAINEANEALRKTNENQRKSIDARDRKIATLSADKERLAEQLESIGWDLHKAKQEVKYVEAERDAYRQGIYDFEYVVKCMKKQLAEEKDRADSIQAKEDAKKERFFRGRETSKLERLLTKIETHIEYTKSQNENGEYTDAINRMQGVVDRVSTINYSQIPTKEVKDIYYAALSLDYKTSDLAPIKDENLRELVKDRKKSRGIHIQ